MSKSRKDINSSMNLKDELVRLGFAPLRVKRNRQTWGQPGQRRVVLIGNDDDAEKLRKLRRRSFHKGTMIYED